jgi:hypothetical protein
VLLTPHFPRLTCSIIATTNEHFVGGEKSTTQKLSDSTRSGADDAQSGGKSYLDSASEAAGNLANSASETVSNAADYVSGTAKDTTK